MRPQARAFVAALLLAGCTHRAPAPPEGPVAGAMNAAFHGVYARARAREAVAGPRIVVEPARMTLYRGDRAVESVAVDTPAFHLLKAFAHAPIAAYVIVRPDSAGLVGADEVRAFVQAIADAEAALPTSGLRADQQARARALAQTSRDVLQRHLRGELDAAAALAFARAAAPAMLASTDEAARIHIDLVHAAVQRWRARLSADEWSRLRVLILGVHQARRLGAGTQYFAGLLGECGAPLGYPGEGVRVHYLEMPPPAPTHRQLTGLVDLDAEVGEAFFADRARLATDLLADGARRRIAELGGFTALPCPAAPP